MIESTHPLSPSQKGMLFETLASRRAGLHVEQAVIDLRGDVDPATLAAAWERVAAQHPILRTVFRWDGLDEPVQDVLAEPRIEIAFPEWSASWLDEDRARPFDLANGPLLRVALFARGDGSYQSVWTTHHILLDGWSVALVVRDLVACYDALRRGEEPRLASPRPYSDYIDWLQAQDASRAEQFWRRNLAAIDKPTSWSADLRSASPSPSGFSEKKLLFSRALAESLRRLTRRARLPLGVLFQAMWALLLSRYSNEETVIFGATVSGRPPELEGVESMIGLFINTVPIAVTVPRDTPFREWLTALHREQSERETFDYCSTGQIHEWSAIPAALPLFESILVFENYPHDGAAFISQSLTVDLATSRSIGANTRYPLNLIVEPDAEIAITAVYDQSRIGAADAALIAGDFLVLAEAIVAAPDDPVGALLDAMRRRPVPRMRPAARATSDDTQPRNAMEARVAAVWSEVLGLETIGIHDDFFALGGHSLLATRLVSRLRETLGLDVSLRTVFEHPTIAELATMAPIAAPSEAVTAPRQSRPSFQQERLWFVDQLEGGSAAYNAQAALAIAGDLDIPVLQACFDELLRRHEILRTAFRAVDGSPRLEVLEPCSIPIEQIDCADRDEIERRAAEEMLRPFDLAAPPLLRVLLLRVAPREHVLVLTIHHIVTDGWSNSVLFGELAALYDAFSNGHPSPLPPLPMQYGDYAARQRQSLEGESLQTLLDHWRGKLQGAPPRLGLPTDFPRPATQSGRGAMQTMQLCAELTAALRELCRAEKATLFMALLAAFDVLLHRLSGQDDVVVGTPVANRGSADVEGLIGFFVNTLALRTSLAGRPSHRELLRRVRETALDAYAHQEMPFERLVEELRPDRDLSRNPLFQVFLNMLNVPTAAPALGTLDIRPLPLPELVTRFDLTLYAIDEGDALRLELLYDVALFSSDTAERMLAQLRLILEEMAADPDAAIDACSLVRDEDRALLPDPRQPIEVADHGAIHDGFRASVDGAPWRVAVTSDGRSWTYAEVDALSSGVANALMSGGIRHGDLVAIHAKPSAPLIWSLLGVLKAGAAFLILDAAHPRERLRRVLDIAKPATVLTLDSSPEHSSTTDPRIAVAPDDLAYVAFTSGTTGEPLGIAGAHRPVAHFLDWQARTFNLGEDDRFSLLSGLSHDPLLRDVFTPLSIGASIHIPPPGVRESEELARWMAESLITVAHLTPSLGELLHGRLPSLRWAFFGGEPLRRELVTRLRAQAPSCRVVNFYGTTETPQAMAFHAADDDASPIVPIGRGIDGVQLLLLNGAGTPAGIGEQAEVCVRTPYLSRGYLDGAARGFDAARGIYRTGDLGRYRADGAVTISRRKDEQLKIRGFRIEPREVEAVLQKHPRVRQAMVASSESGDALIACVVGPVTADECRSFAAKRLPASHVPAQILVVEAMPLTPNGKLDRRALAAAAEPYQLVAPADAIETALVAIWKEVLGTESVGATSDFFALGGHSLKATRVVSRIQRDLGVHVPLRELFRAPVLRDLAAIVRELRPKPRRAIEPLPAAETYAVSHAQRRLWTLAQLGDTAAAYNMPRALLLDGTLDATALAEALRDVVARHESLRTTFTVIGGEVRQRVNAESIDVPLVDFSPELIEEDAARPFDLERGPLVRASLLRIADDRHVLLFNAHHIVVDAWSLDVLVRELVIAYDARTRRAAPQPEPLRIQYRDYAAWQNAMLESEDAAAHREYWKQKLAAPLPVLELPLDFQRPPVKSWNGRRLPFALTTEETAALAALARAQNVSLYMLLVACVKALLHRYTGCDDLIIGAPVAGRGDADLEDQIGFYVNVLPLRDAIDGEFAFSELLQSVARTATEAYEHQEYPFDRLVSDLNVPRETSRSPLFDVVVVLQNADRSELRLGGVRIEPFPQESRGSKFDLNFTFQEEDGRLGGYIEYNTDLWREDRAARAVAHFRELARSVTAAPHEPLSRLNILPEEERHLVVDELNATDAAYPQRTIHELFDEQAIAHEEEIAVIFGARRLTYGELRCRSNAVAGVLRERGVVRGDLVAVKLERSERMIVALLGVLKAGAAYVPIDPSLPEDRVRFILEDSGCRVVVDEALLDAPPPRKRAAAETGSPDDAAYVIYTSGSTGTPKGCIVTHRNVVRLLVNDRFRFDFSARDTWLAAHSFSFDFSVWEMYGALLYGGRLVVARREDVRNPAALRALVREQRVTVLNQTPASFYALIDVERGEAVHDLDRHLRYIIFGGDRLDPAQLRDWASIYPLERVRLVNMYGITETTVHVTYGPLGRDDVFGAGGRSPIGVPLPETRVYVCGSGLTPQPLGVAGELYVGGSGVCRGYLDRPELTAQRFIPSPFREGETLYRTGDVGRWLPNGTLEYFGRNDDQVQIRGFRVELGEIERVLASHPRVRNAVVRVHQRGGDARDVDKRLIAWFAADDASIASELRALAKTKLPDYMVPSDFIAVDAIPLTSNGKVDAAALPLPSSTAPSTATGAEERVIAAIWSELLGRDRVAVDENFFDLGGHSLLLVQLQREVRARLGADIPLVEFFRLQTVRAIAELIRGKSADALPVRAIEQPAASNEIAIIGMAGRFPGAPDLDAFWRNLRDGVESSATLTDHELRASGVADSLIADPRYVRRKPVLDGIEELDAAFFGLSPREAEVMDPQHRLFLECSWEALEHAGYGSSRADDRIGVFGGVSFNSYLLNNLLPNRDALDALGSYTLVIGNDRDFVTTRVSYKLNLTGPSINVSTACSTSLVAVHLACRSLIDRQCDMALAGGASVKVPQKEGYLYDEGGILSPDGRCRAFDAEANGTVGGSGAGIVVLKRLADAIRDGDNVLAVIKGSAIGNDGSEKIGYTAPSVTRQAAVIADAHAIAGVDPESLSYVEAHGTGTTLGDPIEITALTQAFRTRTSRSGFCAIGSVKTNIGHLDAAAGVAGLIKAVLSLQRKQIPPSINYRRPNPKIDFDATPFFVNDRLADWRSNSGPRRAGVSSFGLGGTNVHVVLEEAPHVAPAADDTRPLQLLPISARTPSALAAVTARLATQFEEHPETSLSDAAWTLAIGRKPFEHRAFAVCADASDAAQVLRANDPRRVIRGQRREQARNVAFLFPGGGAQHARMAEGLYASEKIFRETFDRCAEILGLDLRAHIRDEQAMVTTSLGLPALFTIEYALARLWMSWGIKPTAMIGHSLGEYVAACLAGVFSLEDALALVAERGRLFETIERGEMLSVPLSEQELAPYLRGALSIAAINNPSSCVVSGPLAAIDALSAELAGRDVDARRLHITVAAHSTLVDPIVDPFREFVSRLTLRVPEIPFVSNLSGDWITAEQACDPSYWSSHLRHTVRFGDGVAVLLRDPDAALLEVGPGTTLTSLAQRHPARLATHLLLASMRHPNDAQSDLAVLLGAAGRLWIEGAPLDWRAMHGANARRIALPGTVFERKRYWIDPPKTRAIERKRDVAEWFYAPSWRRTTPPPPSPRPPVRWLLVADAAGLRDELAARLGARGDLVATARPGDDFDALFAAGTLPDRIVDASAAGFDDGLDRGIGCVRGGFYTLRRIALAWRRQAPDRDVRITVVTTNAHDVTGDEPLRPEKATAFGLVQVIGQECARIRCNAVDLTNGVRAAAALETELLGESNEMFVAWRGRHRWTLGYEQVRLPLGVVWASGLPSAPAQRQAGGLHHTVLITGGTGGVGRFLARQLTASGGHVAIASRNATASDIRDALLIDADVADETQLRAAIKRCEEHFGALHGVIHAAAVTSGPSIFRLFDELTDEDCETQFRPKIDGVRSLASALSGRALDFVLLMSSNASVLGGLGLSAYAAANHFLDAFVAQQNRIGSVPWISANWDGWPSDARQRATAPATSIDRFAMSEAEAIEAFRRVTASHGGQIVVSAGDLAARLDRWTRLDPREEQAEAELVVEEQTGDAPDAPRGPVQQTVAALWRDMLGVQRIGIFDNFFELRGDSLLGTRMITRLNRHFTVRVPLRALFEDPTVAGLAERVETLLAASTATPHEQEALI